MRVGPTDLNHSIEKSLYLPPKAGNSYGNSTSFMLAFTINMMIAWKVIDK